MRFSSRVDAVDLNPIARLEQQLRTSGVTLDSLNDSNPTAHGLAPRALPGCYRADPRGPVEVRRVLAQLCDRRKLCARRNEQPGHRRNRDSRNDHQRNAALEPARDVAAQASGTLHTDHTDPDRLYVLSSTSQAYSWLMKLLCDPGDVILAPTPGYPLIESIAALEGVRVAPYALRYDGSWGIDLGGLEATLRGPLGSRIRALAVINPNNPTGSYVKRAERERIVELCASYEVALIADEVFYDFPLEPFDGNRRIAGEMGVLTFALDGFSKMLAAPHAKLGWIQVSGPAGDVQQAQRRLDMIADDYLPMSDLIAGRVPDLLAEAPLQTARVLDRVTANITTLHRLLDEDRSGLVSVLRAEGGWNVLLRIPQVLDENAVIIELMRRHHLTGQPGYFFDMPSPGYLALSLLPEAAKFSARVHAVLDVVAGMMA